MRFELHKRSGQKFRRLALNRYRQMEKASPRPFSPADGGKAAGAFFRRTGDRVAETPESFRPVPGKKIRALSI